MKTKEEILKTYPSVKLGLDDHYGKRTVYNAMDEYAKLHVKAALSAAAENAESTTCYGEGKMCWSCVDKDSILNAYPDENFKLIEAFTELICPHCGKYKTLQGNGIIHQLCECSI